MAVDGALRDERPGADLLVAQALATRPAISSSRLPSGDEGVGCFYSIRIQKDSRPQPRPGPCAPAVAPCRTSSQALIAMTKSATRVWTTSIVAIAAGGRTLEKCPLTSVSGAGKNSTPATIAAIGERADRRNIRSRARMLSARPRKRTTNAAIPTEVTNAGFRVSKRAGGVNRMSNTT